MYSPLFSYIHFDIKLMKSKDLAIIWHVLSNHDNNHTKVENIKIYMYSSLIARPLKRAGKEAVLKPKH